MRSGDGACAIKIASHLNFAYDLCSITGEMINALSGCPRIRKKWKMTLHCAYYKDGWKIFTKK